MNRKLAFPNYQFQLKHEGNKTLVFDDSFQETSSLFELLKSKRLDSSVQKYFFKVLNDATSLELVIKKDVILDGLYIKLLLERLCLYGGF